MGVGMSKCLIYFYLFVSATAYCSVSSAAIVTVAWEAEVTEVRAPAVAPPGAIVGSAITGSFDYDTDTLGLPFSGTLTSYPQNSAPYQINVPGEPLFSSSGLGIQVSNDASSIFTMGTADELVIFATSFNDGDFSFFMRLTDFDSTMFSDQSLPLIDQNLLDQTERREASVGVTNGGVNTSNALILDLTSMQVTAVPEPSTSALLAAAGGVMVISRRKRQRIRATRKP
jgi:hypothetical protein